MQDVQSTTVQSRVRPSRRGKTRWGVHLGLIVVCFVICIPALYALQVATLTTNESFLVPPKLFPPSGDFDNNVRTLWDSRGFDQLILNTVVISLVVVVAKTAMAMLAGMVFVFYRFPGRVFLFFFVLLTLLLPTEIILQPLVDLMAELQWGANNPRLVLTMPFLASAVGVFLFRQHFTNIPRELAEAAQIDGATAPRFLFSVLVPMSWNVIGAHAMIQFIAMWNQYVWPVVMSLDREDQVIQVGVANAATVSGQADFGLLMTAGVIASIPPLILFILLQKQFMSGFTLTRDK
jgi:sn-glycerol 3-phosphate transport system permease protein